MTSPVVRRDGAADDGFVRRKVPRRRASHLQPFEFLERGKSAETLLCARSERLRDLRCRMSGRVASTKRVQRFRLVDRMKQLDARAIRSRERRSLAQWRAGRTALVANRYQDLPDAKARMMHSSIQP